MRVQHDELREKLGQSEALQKVSLYNKRYKLILWEPHDVINIRRAEHHHLREVNVINTNMSITYYRPFNYWNRGLVDFIESFRIYHCAENALIAYGKALNRNRFNLRILKWDKIIEMYINQWGPLTISSLIM